MARIICESQLDTVYQALQELGDTDRAATRARCDFDRYMLIESSIDTLVTSDFDILVAHLANAGQYEAARCADMYRNRVRS